MLVCTRLGKSGLIVIHEENDWAGSVHNLRQVFAFGENKLPTWYSVSVPSLAEALS